MLTFLYSNSLSAAVTPVEIRSPQKLPTLAGMILPRVILFWLFSLFWLFGLCGSFAAFGSVGPVSSDHPELRSAETLDNVIPEVQQLIQAKKREQALSLLVGAAKKATGETQATLIRRTGVVSKQFFTNQAFQIYQDGLNLIAGKKCGSAREKLEKANSIEPDNNEILLRLGQCLVLDNVPKEAVSYLRAAEKLNPFDIEVRLWLGRALHLKGQFLEAASELRKIFRESPSLELAPVWLAESLHSAGQVNAALRVLDSDLKGYPFHLMSLLTGARFKIQIPRAESQVLWSARKDLQLALSRLDHYFLPASQGTSSNGEFSLNLRRSRDEIMSEIQKLLQQVQGRLDLLTSR